MGGGFEGPGGNFVAGTKFVAVFWVSFDDPAFVEVEEPDLELPPVDDAIKDPEEPDLGVEPSPFVDPDFVADDPPLPPPPPPAEVEEDPEEPNLEDDDDDDDGKESVSSADMTLSLDRERIVETRPRFFFESVLSQGGGSSSGR